MAQFYAKIKGARGPASRLGHKNSGMQVDVCSWEGMVFVDMYHDERAKRDMVRVTFGPHWNGPYTGNRVVLYDGPCDGWREYQDAGELGKLAWRAAYARLPDTYTTVGE
jgi:hypothetical protein